jgi:FlaA1/EpsC-like NDP-sugar epimerase
MEEEHVLEPTNPYAATKAAAEFLVKSYHRSFNLPVIITRGNNVYGPHQFPEKLIPKFTNQLLRGRPVTLHGAGTNTRNFLYVTDVARAFEFVLFKGQLGQIYNIGGSHEVPNIDIAKKLIKLLKLEAQEGEKRTLARAFASLVVSSSLQFIAVFFLSRVECYAFALVSVRSRSNLAFLFSPFLRLYYFSGLWSFHSLSLILPCRSLGTRRVAYYLRAGPLLQRLAVHYQLHQARGAGLEGTGSL